MEKLVNKLEQINVKLAGESSFTRVVYSLVQNIEELKQVRDQMLILAKESEAWVEEVDGKLQL